jgi:hypothetical protein
VTLDGTKIKANAGLGDLIPDLNPPRWALPKSRGSKAD